MVSFSFLENDFDKKKLEAAKKKAKKNVSEKSTTGKVTESTSVSYNQLNLKKIENYKKSKELDMVKEQKTETQKRSSFSSWINPKNWGVKDYSDKGDFNRAYYAAKKDGKTEFIWNNKRYNTKYAGTIRQEVGSYGVNGKKIDKNHLDYPPQVNVYKPSKQYPVGHIAAQLTDYLDNNPSVDYSAIGNNRFGIDTKQKYNRKTYNVYGDVDKEHFEKKAFSLPLGIYSVFLDSEDYEPSDWNLFTNNCADNVCDAFNIPRKKGIETPNGALNKIKNKYPTLEATGRTYDDYYNLSTSLKNINADNILKNSKNLIGISYSPDLQKTSVSRNIISNIQRSLVEKGYKLPKSTKEDGTFDGVLGDETKNALLEYRKSQNK